MLVTTNIRIEVQGQLEPTILPIEIDTVFDGDYSRLAKELSDRVKAVALKDLQTGLYGLRIWTLDEGEWDECYEFKYRSHLSLDQVRDLTKRFIQKRWFELAWSFGYPLVKKMHTALPTRISDSSYNDIIVKDDAFVNVGLQLEKNVEEPVENYLDRLSRALEAFNNVMRQ